MDGYAQALLCRVRRHAGVGIGQAASDAVLSRLSPVRVRNFEDLTHSSRNDERVIKSTMSKARELARDISPPPGHIVTGNDITAWFNIQHLRAAILREDGQKSRVEASSVMMEYERAGDD